jgi:hypothetical protein
MSVVLTVDQQLEEFWGWHPPLLKPHAKHTKSDQTRPPSHYDMHLDERLRLKRIVPFPSLLTDLTAVVDNALRDVQVNLPPTDDRAAFLQRHRAQTLGEMVTSVKDEDGVADFYMNSTAKFCAPVASMLGLQHPQWKSVLVCDRQTHQKASAIADGFLKINTEVEEAGFLASPLKPEIECHLKAIAREGLSNLAVWEFKNLLAGSEEVMRAIGSLKGPFDWFTCPEEDNFLCGADSKHLTKGGKLTITGSPMGFDAAKTPWDINKKASRSHKRKIKLNRGEDEDDRDYEDDGDYDDDVDYLPSGYVIEATDLGKAHNIIQQVILFTLSYNIDIDYSDFQKTWAEAVRNDATILVVNSGNFEFIGVRHRDSQTLFLSPLIEVQTTPAYAKLHTGLYIAAFHDTVCRALQLRNAKKRPPTWTHKYYPDDEYDYGEDVSQKVSCTCTLLRKYCSRASPSYRM